MHQPPATLPAVTFGVPGDIGSTAGAHVFDRAAIAALRELGHPVTHLALPAGFPEPSAAEEAEAARQLAALPPGRPLILDGWVCGAIPTPALKALKGPLVAMIHHPLALETGLPPERAALLARREAANLALAAAIMVPSPHTADCLVQDYGVPRARITVTSPGFPPPDLLRQPSDPPLILAAGVMNRRKSHDVLLAALAEIADLPWQALVAGAPQDPAVVAELAAQRRALGLETRVTLPGALPRAALTEAFRRADVFALASRYEGYGMVFAEALLHGVPVVACRAGAIPDTVPPEAGILVPPGDAKAFATALRRLLSEPGLHPTLAAGARAAGHRLPRWTDTAARMSALLCKLSPQA